MIVRRVPLGWVGLASASALAVLWRAPFMRLPITTDEAGYVTIARLWAHGAPLYRAAWVDRPQGLLIVFRMLAALGGSVLMLRMAAVAAGVALVLLIAAIGRELGGDRAAVAAALVAGALGCSPFLESFTLSGELLAAVPSAACVLCGVRWLQSRRGGWLVGAGLLCGCAVLVKQSAFDGGAAVALMVAATDRRRVRSLALFGLAALAPVAAAAATAPSFGDWWFAVVTYRFRGSEFVHGVSSIGWSVVADVAVQLLEGIGPLALVALVGIRWSPPIVRVWLATAAVGAVGGGLFHAHYFIELVPPLALSAGFGLARARPRVAVAVAVAAFAVALATVAPALGQPTLRQVHLIFPSDSHLATDAVVARIVRESSRAHSTLLVLPPTASIGYLARRRSAIPYLWARNVLTMRAARAAERRAILRRLPSTIVVERQAGFMHAADVPTATIARFYVQVARRGGATVYRLRASR